MSKDKDIESIKSKILKLHALAESGNTHEAQNARAMLERWLRQYGLSLENILDESNKKRWYKFKARNKWEKKLLLHCYFKVKNVAEVNYRGGEGTIVFELTSYEFAEITNYYEWHRKQLAKELKAMQANFTDAYILKHNITSECGRDVGDEELTPEQKARIMKVLTLMKTVENTSYKKLLEQ